MNVEQDFNKHTLGNGEHKQECRRFSWFQRKTKLAIVTGGCPLNR